MRWSRDETTPGGQLRGKALTGTADTAQATFVNLHRACVANQGDFTVRT